MLSTIFFAALFLAILAVAVVTWGFCLYLGLRWVKAPIANWRRIALATCLNIVAQIAIYTVFALLPPAASRSLVTAFAQLAASVIAPCVLISFIFKLPTMRAAQAWLPTLAPPVGAAAFSILVLRPFLYEAFVIPTNPMAPTLVGAHLQSVCPECGRPNYGSIWASDRSKICDNFHVNQVPDASQRVYSGDRILVAKFLKPRRWDMVVFQLPQEAKATYVMRLVGLPGETIHIDEGFVWVDGKKLTPPDSIQGLRYLSELPFHHTQELWGTPTNPARLGSDEYFVLGDFSDHSSDSRLWERGAAGHNPFAVPESHMTGVVTHTYWPLHRARIHR